MTQAHKVLWPDNNHPSRTSIHVRNELDMEASVESVWDCLVRAYSWPSWYKNAAKMHIHGADNSLAMGTVFRWKTMGITIECTVVECVVGERLAWRGKAFGIEAYHAWVLQESSRGCHVLTEETQRGWPASLGKLFSLPAKMYDAHQAWLRSLEERASRLTKQ